MLPEELGQAKAQGEGGGKDQPGIGHQAVVVEGDLDPVGVVTWCIYRVLLSWDRFSVSKPLSQIQRRTLLFLQQASYTPSFGGLGLRNYLKI